MKKKHNIFIIVILLSLPIVFLCILLYFKIIKNNDKTSLDKYNHSSLNKRIILADILKNEKDNLITADDIDNIIEDYFDIKNGIYISKKSREKFLDIINSISQGTRYFVNEEGYLSSTILNYEKCSALEQEINKFLNSNKTIVVSIGNTYKTIVDGEQLDMLIERDSYVKKISYDEKMKIAIINSRVLNDVSEENKKDFYENILITILQE